MSQKTKTSEYSFQAHEDGSTIHGHIIRQNEETIIIEEDNTIYEMDKKCAIARGWIH